MVIDGAASGTEEETMPTYEHITVEYSFQDRIATVILRRPEVHNAFNAQVVMDLANAFTALSVDERLHGIVLTGEGASFCAGADINQMKEAGTYTAEQNLEDALRLADMLQTINTSPCPVIARINGTAMGGGVGLIAVSDIAISTEHARFAFSEVKLGIAPAVISPYVLRKIGETNARVLFTTGERFSAARAHSMGLVHAVVPSEQLDDAVGKAIQELLSSAPQALRASKTLALTVRQMNYEEARNYTVQTIANLRMSDEGQEGLRAFLEKRRPQWLQASHPTK
jgi:methylglutaconyl-CoA hydratase